MKTVSPFIKKSKRDNTDQVRVKLFRDVMNGLINTGSWDEQEIHAETIDSLVKVEINTANVDSDNERFLRRLSLLRCGLIQLLKRDDEIDGSLLAISGIAKGDVK